MQYLLAMALFFGILTLWVPGYWAAAVLELSLFALAIAAMFHWRRTTRFAYPLAPLLFAVLWGLLQYWRAWTISPFETRIALARWTAMLAVFIAGLIIFQDARVHRWFRYAMLWFGFFVALFATLQTFTSKGKVFWIFQTEYSDQVMGPILYHNHYAAFIEIVFPLALYESLRRKRESLLYSALAAAMLASVIASASRAGCVLVFAEFVVVVALMWLHGSASGRSVAIASIRFVLLLALFTAVVGWGTIWQRLHSPDPFLNRREFAASSIRMIADRPWLGFGLGTWPVAYPAYAVVDTGAFANRAHNDWLEWTADGGLPLGVAILTLFLWCLRPAFLSPWGIGAVAVFLHATVDYPFSRPALAAWTMVMMALLATATNRHSNKSPLLTGGLPAGPR